MLQSRYEQVGVLIASIVDEMDSKLTDRLEFVIQRDETYLAKLSRRTGVHGDELKEWARIHINEPGCF